MKFFSLTFLLSLAVLGLAGCPGSATNTTGNNSNSRTNTAMSNANMTNSNTAVVVNSNVANANGNVVNSTSSTATPNGFMTEAAKGGMAEVELGKLAVGKAQNPEVKRFAQQMIADHTRANNELKTLAGKKSVTLPTDVGAEHKATMDKLSKLSGAEFDKEYVRAMVEDHEKDVKEFQTQSATSTDTDVKAFAAKTLPTLQSHLTMIKGIQGKMK